MTHSLEYKRLTRDELETIAGEPLPERAAMSLIKRTSLRRSTRRSR